MDNNTYVLEWSQKQNSFHVQQLSASVKGNQRAFMQNRSCDYIVLHVGTEQECSNTADMLRPTLVNRLKVAA